MIPSCCMEARAKSCSEGTNLSVTNCAKACSGVIAGTASPLRKVVLSGVCGTALASHMEILLFTLAFPGRVVPIIPSPAAAVARTLLAFACAHQGALSTQPGPIRHRISSRFSKSDASYSRFRIP